MNKNMLINDKINNTYNTYHTPKTNFINIMNKFEKGVINEENKRLEMRKDAVMLINYKNKFHKIQENYKENIRLQKKLLDYNKYPHYILKGGKDLFELNNYDLVSYTDIYEMNFTELEDFDFNFLSYLTKLFKLEIKFSKIFFSLDQNFQYNKFYQSLLYLSLPCNNLSNEILNIVNNISTLKTLNLMGNRINGNMPFIGNLKNLEELDLSYNIISSHFTQDFSSYESSKENTNETLNKTFDQWQKYLKTNLQEFYHNIGNLKKLKTLNLSNNKIHFFDINPFYIQQIDGFSQLERLDLSNNKIEEEISILLVINIVNLKWLDLNGNPIINNTNSYRNIEFDIFKNKNILITSDSLIKEFHYKIKKYKLTSNKIVDKKLKVILNEISGYRKKIDDYLNVNNKNEQNFETNSQETKELIEKNKKSNLFITNEMIKASETKTHPKVKTYDEFLILAKKCFGKEKHYKEKVPISKAYQRLRYLMINLPTEGGTLNSEIILNYMKPTVSRTMHLDKNSCIEDLKLISKASRGLNNSHMSIINED